MKKVNIDYYCDDGGGACLYECPDAEYCAEISDELFAQWEALEARRDQILDQVQKLVDESEARRPKRPLASDAQYSEVLSRLQVVNPRKP